MSHHPPRVVQFLSKCQHEDGGFAGGPGQLAHLAPTYAAILSLAILGTQEAYNCIDRWVGLKLCAGFCIVMVNVCMCLLHHWVFNNYVLDMVTIMR